MQHHFVVYFDDVTKTWHIDEGTTQARFEDGNVWVEDKKKFLEGEWQDSNDTTSDALDNLRELIEVDSESDEPIQTEAYQDIDPNSTYGSFPEDMDDCIESDWCDFCEMSVQAEPVMGYLRGNCPHCGNMCS